MAFEEAHSFQVKCVVAEHSDLSDVSEQLTFAFNGLTEKGLEPQWIREEECLQIQTQTPILFICDRFSGPAFEHLKSLQFRILGPLCVLECLTKNHPFPVGKNPIFNLTMKDLVVCCTNIEKNIREDLHEKIQLMGGEISRGFTDLVTHLVANQVGSKKYKVACHYKKSIMLPCWVEECWKASQKQIISAKNPQFNKFRCPIFQGLSVTVTQIDIESRQMVKKLIETNGGEYSGDLRAKKTTHLISTAPEGQKYMFAKKWMIKCVQLNWLHDSISNGFCMDEALYELEDKNVKTSTPISDNNMSLLTASNISNISDATIRSNINETMVSMQKSPLQQQPEKDTSSTNWESLDSFNISKLPNNCFLDGCKVFLSGFSGKRLTKVLKMINVGGATRFNNPSNMVSHVIVGEVGKGDIQSLKDKNSEAYIVSIEWLLDCCRSGKRIEESRYELIKQNPVELLEPKAISVHKSLSVDEKDHERSKIVTDIGTTCELDDIMSQYLQQPETTNETSIQNLSNEDAHDDEDANQSKCSLPAPTVFTQDTQQEAGLFNDLTFIVVGFSEEDTNIIIEMIEENHGQILKTKKKGIPDFAVVPLFGFNVERTVKEIVTNCWLQVCIENGERLSIDSNELFRPLPIDADLKPLEGCILSISQYEDTERECLILLAEQLGALYQEFFVRKANPNTNLVPSTHLVCKLPEGSKYLGSVNWKIPAVSKGWLIACAKLKKRVPEQEFLIGSSNTSMASETHNQTLNTSLQMHDIKQKNDTGFQNVQESINSGTPHNTSMTPPVQRLDFSTGKNSSRKQDVTCTPVNLQFSEMSNAELTVKSNPASSRLPRVGITPCKTPRLQINRIKELISEDGRTKTPDSAGIDTPNKFLNADIEFNPSFDVTELNQVLNSSATPSSRRGSKRKSSLPLEDLFHYQLQNALNEKAETSDSPNSSFRTHRRRIVSEVTNKPLFGVIVCISKKLSARHSELYNIVASLGGDYRWVYDNNCTHFIYQGKSNDNNRELKTAKEQGKFIVCPEWIYACRDSNSKTDESLYPFTFNPNMTLSITPVKVISKPASAEKNTQNSNSRSKISSPETTETSDDQGNDPTVIESDKACSSTAEIQQVIQRQIGEIMLATEKNKNRRQTRVTPNSSFSGENSKNSSRNHTPEPNLTSPRKKPLEPIEHSEIIPIIWDDPIDRLEREKIADQLSKESQPVNDWKVDDKEEVQEEEPTNTIEVISPNGNKENNPVSKLEKPLPKVMLSGMSNQERMSYANLVESLGGSISESQHFDISCTHLIVGQPSRNEKFLASLASGKWILQKSYLEACQRQKRFVEEEEHEWNEDAVKQLGGRIDNQTLKLAVCAKQWREKIMAMQKCSSGRSVGAFQNWQVIIHTESQREKSFRRLLEAGGAVLVTAKYPYSQPKGATHAFIELTKTPQKDVDFRALVAANVLCLKPEYIAIFLTDGSINLQNFVLPEAAAVSSGIDPLIKRSSESSLNLSKRLCSR